MKNFIEKNINYFFLINFLLTFYLIYNSHFYSHWSVNLDQDFTLVYNSLILNSGLKTEYFDHPGYSQILLMSYWLDFLKLIKAINFSDLDGLKTSSNFLNDFQKIFIYCRFLNGFIILFFSILIYKLCFFYSKNYFNSYFSSLLFILSFSILNNSQLIRTELLSSFCIYLSLFFFLDSIVNKKILSVTFFSFFLCFSLFSKFQSIFILPFFPLFLIFYFNNKNYFFKKNISLKILNFFNIIFVSLIVIIFTKYVNGFLNFLFLPTILIIFSAFFYFLSKDYYFYKIFSFFTFLGFVICGLFFLTKSFDTNNINVVVNAFGFSNMFVFSDNPYNFSVTKIISNFFYILKKDFYLKILFKTFSVEFFLLIIILFYFFIKKKDRQFIFFILCLILLLSLIFSFRPSKNYLIYISPLIFLCISIFFKNNKITSINVSICFLIFIFFLLNNINYFKKKNSLGYYEITCSAENINNQFSYIRWWHQGLDNDFFFKLCKKDLTY